MARSRTKKQTRKRAALKKPRRAGGKPLADRLRATARARGLSGAAAEAERKVGKGLKALLEDPFHPVRHSAAFALTVLGDDRIVHEFIASLENATSTEIAKAALALGDAGYQNAVPYLLAAFADADRTLAAALAHALGRLGSMDAVPMLLSALDRSFVPAEAAEALGRLNATQAIPSLIRTLSHRDAKARAAAAYSLGLVRQDTADGEASCRLALQALTLDPIPKVRVCAAVALLERGDPGAVETVRAALESTA
jgi:HEAT repeat protein